MPVQPKYSWSETQDAIVLRVFLTGVKPDKANVEVADVLVKVNAPPYFLQIDLFKAVAPSSKTLQFNASNQLEIALKKANPELWGTLIYKGSAAEMQKRREASVARADQEKQSADSRSVQKDKMAKQSMEAHWEVERAQRKAIEEIKEKEKQSAESDINSWADNSNPTPQRATPTATGSSTSSSSTAPLTENSSARSNEIIPTTTKTEGVEKAAATPPPPPPARIVPPVRARQTQKIVTSFTQTSSGAPSRAAPADVEVERKSAAKDAATSKEGSQADVRDSMAVGFLKDKGDTFFHAKVYEAALNAYEAALKLDKDHVPTLVNRALCYLRMAEETRRALPSNVRKWLNKCIEDCTSALASLASVKGEKTSQQKQETVVALTHRSTAFSHLGNHQRALEDLTQSLNSATEEQKYELEGDVDRVGFLVQQLKAGRDAIAEQEGEQAASAGLFSDAIAKFTEAINVNPARISTYVKRASCSLSLLSQNLENRSEAAESAIDDCTVALSYHEDAGDFGDKKMKRHLLHLRASAYAWLKEFTNAKADAEASMLGAEGQDAADAQALLTRVTRLHDAVINTSEAEVAYRTSRFEDAANLFQAAFDASGDGHLLSNRAACLLHLKRYTDCVESCSTAVEMLKQNLSQSVSHPSRSISGRVRKWLQITFARRGAALCQLGQLEAGRADLVQAASMLAADTEDAAGDDCEALNATEAAIDLEKDIAAIDALIAKRTPQ